MVHYVVLLVSVRLDLLEILERKSIVTAQSVGSQRTKITREKQIVKTELDTLFPTISSLLQSIAAFRELWHDV